MIPAIIGGIQAAAGIAQGLIGGASARRAQRKLSSMIDNYKPDASIQDYYSKALQRYNTNPYNSQTYQMQAQNAQRGASQAINALGDRRSALAGIGGIVQNQNDSLLKAGALAEQQQAGQLAQLGQATGMKAQEDKYKFEAKANLLGQKAAGANMTANAGIQNAFNGLGSISNYYTAKKVYGNGNSL